MVRPQVAHVHRVLAEEAPNVYARDESLESVFAQRAREACRCWCSRCPRVRSWCSSPSKAPKPRTPIHFGFDFDQQSAHTGARAALEGTAAMAALGWPRQGSTSRLGWGGTEDGRPTLKAP
jgi:hypothetical protein